MEFDLVGFKWAGARFYFHDRFIFVVLKGHFTPCVTFAWLVYLLPSDLSSLWPFPPLLVKSRSSVREFNFYPEKVGWACFPTIICSSLTLGGNSALAFVNYVWYLIQFSSLEGFVESNSDNFFFYYFKQKSWMNYWLLSASLSGLTVFIQFHWNNRMEIGALSWLQIVTVQPTGTKIAEFQHADQIKPCK